MGFNTIPAVISSFMEKAIETANRPRLWAKFVVPSRGSIIHMHSAPLLSSPLSSASIPCSGNTFMIVSIINLSDSISDSVSRSFAPFFWTLRFFPKLALSILAPSYAAAIPTLLTDFRSIGVSLYICCRVHVNPFCDCLFKNAFTPIPNNLIVYSEHYSDNHYREKTRAFYKLIK